MKKQSRHDKILEHLKTYGSITGIEALERYGCYRLSSVINRLRKSGYNIETVMQYGNGYSYARYYMEERYEKH